ncbi:MAG: hypothetical protein FWC81_03150 [Coriobacteriia bacterium]|nr:hypothetical protein [Coriobacteriia bacterium]
MARRSPMNNRYQKGSTPKGVTRKSAASAKPKRAAGQSAKAKSRAKHKKQKPPLLRQMPNTPEYKAYRKAWWYCLGLGLVLMILSLVILQEDVYTIFGLAEEQASTLSLAITFMALISVGISLYLDWGKIRPMVRTFEAENKVSSADDKSDKDGKNDKAKKSKRSNNRRAD